MEERGNKTIMCSVFFLDIVEYSKKSVAGQISLKDRFNSYLSAAIRDVPMTDRIILDTGDGAAINFLGDVEDALKAALSLRESLLAEDLNVNPPLLVRMGINLGPVRLVRDINGQPNIVGDGINVAQRVMGFADAAQILVSRSYYDAVSRLSPQYAGMFHYQGSRTDKHVREHEVYAIGYPGDKTTHRSPIRPVFAGQTETPLARLMGSAKMVWYSAATRLDALIEYLATRFQQAEARQRVLYVAVVAVPVLLLIALLVNAARHDGIPVIPAELDKSAANLIQPGSAVAPMTPVPVGSNIKAEGPIPAHSALVPVPGITENVESKNAKKSPNKKSKNKHQSKLKGVQKAKHSENQAKRISKGDKNNNVTTTTTSSGRADAYIIVTCVAGTEVFVDGIRKGRINSSSLTIVAPPGKHTVIVSHASRGIFTQNFELNSGKVVHFKPNLCN